MTKLKTNQIFIIYVIVFSIAALIFKTATIKAEGAELVIQPKVSQQVYKVEINSNPNFEEVKTQVLIDDVKYVAHPQKLAQDAQLSEIVASDIDYSNHEVQQVELEVQRFADSKTEKTKIDTVDGIVNLQFIDTTAPEVTIKKNSVTITEGEDIDVDDYLVSVTDNSFDKVSIDIDEDINTDKPGKYKAIYTATDSSGNTASETLTVIVKAKPEEKPEAEVVAEPVAAQQVAIQPATTQQPVAAVTPVVKTAAPVAVGSNNIGGALGMINGHRANAGLAPLSLAGPGEMAAAATRAAEASGYASHVRPDGRNFVTAFSDRGISHSGVREILTYSGSTAAAKIGWWMSSPAHRAILMSPGATHIALGTSGSTWLGLVYR